MRKSLVWISRFKKLKCILVFPSLLKTLKNSKLSGGSKYFLFLWWFDIYPFFLSIYPLYCIFLSDLVYIFANFCAITSFSGTSVAQWQGNYHRGLENRGLGSNLTHHSLPKLIELFLNLKRISYGCICGRNKPVRPDGTGTRLCYLGARCYIYLARQARGASLDGNDEGLKKNFLQLIKNMLKMCNIYIKMY